MVLENLKKLMCKSEFDNDRYMNRTVNSERKVLVFDMDGTLYQLDGENNGFQNSSLQRAVVKNALKFIVKYENCQIGEAQQIYDQSVQDKIGPSSFLAYRYEITRDQYFNKVWNINPEGIVKNCDQTKVFLSRLKTRRSTLKFILLTSAPKIWANSLLRYIGIADLFEQIFTGEMFGVKDEVFDNLAVLYPTQNICSIGDQLETDILPAQKRGMKTFFVDNPKDLKKLL